MFNYKIPKMERTPTNTFIVLYYSLIEQHRKSIGVLALMAMVLLVSHYLAIMGYYDDWVKWVIPFVIWAAFAFVWYFGRNSAHHSNIFLNAVDEVSYKRYFFNVQTEQPRGHTTLERFLSVAKTISEDNTDFTDNSDYSLKLKDGTTIDFCSQIDESLFDLASPGVKGWFYRNYWKKKIPRYFLVKIFDKVTDEEIAQTLTSVTKHYGATELSQVYRLVILARDINPDFFDTDDLSGKIGKMILNSFKVDLVEDDGEEFSFIWSSDIWKKENTS